MRWTFFEFCESNPPRSPRGAMRSHRRRANRASRARRSAIERDLRDPDLGEAAGREVSERMALLWQAALLVRYAPPSVADAFVASRIEGTWGRTLGTLPRNADLRAILERAAPLPQAVTA